MQGNRNSPFGPSPISKSQKIQLKVEMLGQNLPMTLDIVIILQSWRRQVTGQELIFFCNNFHIKLKDKKDFITINVGLKKPLNLVGTHNLRETYEQRWMRHVDLKFHTIWRIRISPNMILKKFIHEFPIQQNFLELMFGRTAESLSRKALTLLQNLSGKL